MGVGSKSKATREAGVKVTKEEMGTESLLAAAAKNGPNTKAERKAVECFRALEKAEKSFTPGREFGRAVIELRDEIKANHRRNFMKRLEELRITRAKARYWMAIVEGKPIGRGKTAKAKEDPAWDWNSATAQLERLADGIHPLKRDGSEGFIDALQELAKGLGYVLKRDGGKNA